MGNLRSGRRGGASGHDRGYKLLFSDPTLLEELLRGFLPGDWTNRLDFTTLERVGNSFVSADLRERHSDVIWRLRLRGELLLMARLRFIGRICGATPPPSRDECHMGCSVDWRGMWRKFIG